MLAGYAFIVALAVAVTYPWPPHHNHQIKTNTAKITVVNRGSADVEMLWASSACVGCNLGPPGDFDPDDIWQGSGVCARKSSCHTLLPTDYSVRLQLKRIGTQDRFPLTVHLNELASYNWTVTDKADPVWEQVTPGALLNGAVPLIIFPFILAGIAFLAGYVAPRLYDYGVRMYRGSEPSSTLQGMSTPLAPSTGIEEVEEKPKSSKERLRSLDTFRGCACTQIPLSPCATAHPLFNSSVRLWPAAGFA